jgi:hypothetical protein
MSLKYSHHILYKMNPFLREFIDLYDRMCLADERYQRAKDEYNFFKDTEWANKTGVALERCKIANEKHAIACAELLKKSIEFEQNYGRKKK